MTDPLDPLGRIAAHEAQPYDHPTVTVSAMETYWRDFYATEAEALPPEDLATEHHRAAGAVAECEAALRAAEGERLRFAPFERGWDGEEDRRSATIERDTLRHRLVRLTGRKVALASETKRRAGR